MGSFRDFRTSKLYDELILIAKPQDMENDRKYSIESESNVSYIHKYFLKTSFISFTVFNNISY